MRSPTEKQAAGERRKAERRGVSERRTETTRSVAGDRRVVEQRGVAHAMVDALEDILRWERASERALRVAQASTPDVSN